MFAKGTLRQISPCLLLLGTLHLPLVVWFPGERFVVAAILLSLFTAGLLSVIPIAGLIHGSMFAGRSFALQNLPVVLGFFAICTVMYLLSILLLPGHRWPVGVGIIASTGVAIWLVERGRHKAR